jgi:alpha-N-arabinofuranosidase
MNRTFHNPILPGFYPDPSVCRAGEDYYLVTSSFEYFPGLPVFHSRDLVHWRQIGHVLDRPSQLDLDGIEPSRGLYAPTIRYHEGTFYVINTLVEGKRKGYANFVVTASDPAGPWSEPHWIEGAPGIDPSLLFDDDGRVWYTGNRPPPGGREYEGQCEIWLQELDLDTMRLKGERHGIWQGALRGCEWAEAPHLYKINGLYYLMIAEGGTGFEHAVTIARSGNVAGPYYGNPRNPILTHRHLGRGYPVTGTGHADLVQTQKGEWWMVLLAMRPYGGYFYNLGRETFLTPVRWEDDRWPTVSPGLGRVPDEHPAPDLPEQPWPSEPACDGFDGGRLAFCWNFIRTPREAFWSLTERPGFLRLRLRPERISERVNPSFAGRRQQHRDFNARTVMEFTPAGPNECAGLALLQNCDFQYRLVLTRSESGRAVVRLLKRAKGEETLVAERPASPGRTYFKVEARGQDYGFYAAAEPEAWQPVAERVDGRILSTPVAGGFVGAYIGLYASSNGSPSGNVADFDWFEYQGPGGAGASETGTGRAAPAN